MTPQPEREPIKPPTGTDCRLRSEWCPGSFGTLPAINRNDCPQSSESAPTVGLDPQARDVVWERVLDLRNRFGRTMVVTSHHLDEINEFCDRIALIDRGRVAAIGTPSELKARLGPDATLDDVFIKLVASTGEQETEGSYGEVRRARARERG